MCGEQAASCPISPSNLFIILTPTPAPLPLDTLTRENLSCGEGAATKRCTTEDRRPGPSKLSSLHEEDLQEAGGVPSVLGNSPVFPEDIDPLGPAGVVENADVGKVEPPCVDAHERGVRCRPCVLH